MGLSGTSGPFRGAYSIMQFGTESVSTGVGVSTAVQNNLWSWTVPAGMDIEIVDVQLWGASVSGGVRINLLAGGASILETGVNSEQKIGVGLASGSYSTGGGSIKATVSTNVFGTTATTITNSVTPSTGVGANRGRAYGAYIIGGATLSATVSNGIDESRGSGRVEGTILWFPRTHPSSLRHSTE